MAKCVNSELIDIAQSLSSGITCTLIQVGRMIDEERGLWMHTRKGSDRSKWDLNNSSLGLWVYSTTAFIAVTRKLLHKYISKTDELVVNISHQYRSVYQSTMSISHQYESAYEYESLQSKQYESDVSQIENDIILSLEWSRCNLDLRLLWTGDQSCDWSCDCSLVTLSHDTWSCDMESCDWSCDWSHDLELPV